MTTARIHVLPLAVVQAVAFVSAAFSGERWAILPAAASVALIAFAGWSMRRERAERPSQRPVSYREAARREEDTTVVATPRPARKRVLYAEYEEAKAASASWLEAAVGVAAVAAIAGTLWHVGHRWALVPACVLTGGAIVCLSELVQCRLVMRAWRDRERERGER